jgi:hypothetical protein
MYNYNSKIIATAQRKFIFTKADSLRLNGWGADLPACEISLSHYQVGD